MRRLVLGLVVAGSGLLAACGGGEGVVQAALRPEADEAAEPTPLPNFEIRALPYDRDAIFDSLRAAHATPEPEIPDCLAQVQTALVEAQEQLANSQVQGTSGGGAVTVTLNGHLHLIGIDIDPGAVDPDDPSMLEDLILAAWQAAHDQVATLQAQADPLGGLGGMLGGDGPGGLGGLGGLLGGS